jgi:hypothetical protein
LKKDTKPQITAEDKIKQNKIKETHEQKYYLETKLQALDENLKLLQDENLSKLQISKSSINNDHIEDNLKKAKVREIQNHKLIIESKIQTLEDQIQQLIMDENFDAKKFDIRNYLENFEKDQKEAENKVKQYQSYQEEVKRNLEEQRQRDELRLKQSIEFEEKVREEHNIKKNEEYMNRLEKLKMKNKENHEEVEKLKEEWQNKIVVEKNYKYITAEEEFKQKQERKEQERRNKALTDIINKRKTLLKPLNKTELDEHSRKVMEEIHNNKYQREKERLLKQNDLMKSNQLLPRSETNIYRHIVEEEKKIKNHLEKEKLDKLYNQLKIKNFSKEIKENLLPEISEKKKKEREDLIANIENKKVAKLKRKRGQRVLLHKPREPNRYLEGMSKFLEEEKERISRSKSARSNKNEIGIDDAEYNRLHRRIHKSGSPEKRKPLERAPDYLTEIRKQKEVNITNNISMTRDEGETGRSGIYFINLGSERKWERMISNNKYSLLSNIEQIKIKANLLEEKMKMKEVYLKHCGGSEKHPELSEDVSNMMIDAIKAKLTILENITKKDHVI